MNEIIFKQNLAPNIKKIVVGAGQVAKKVLPGQFIVVIVDEKGERIPLTVVDANKVEGTITLIFQEIGKGTYKLGKLEAGARILNLLGPLGRATEIKKIGTVVSVAGGVGIAEVYPVTRAFKAAGNKIISIIGARNKELLFFEQDLRKVSDELLITTDDGSYGNKGNVCDALKQVLFSTKPDLVYAVGPVPMMRKVCELTKPHRVKTLVSLNPIMVDATGMCGSCRVSINGQTQFGCVHGPEFDGHLVDFVQLENRLRLCAGQEKQAMERIKKR